MYKQFQSSSVCGSAVSTCTAVVFHMHLGASELNMHMVNQYTVSTQPSTGKPRLYPQHIFGEEQHSHTLECDPRAARRRPATANASSKCRLETQVHDTEEHLQYWRRQQESSIFRRTKQEDGQDDSPPPWVTGTLSESASMVLACACDACLSCCTATASSGCIPPSSP